MRNRARIHAIVLAILGAVGLLAPYTGKPLGFVVYVEPVVEVVDHVVPGVLVLGFAGYMLGVRRVALVPALGATLAGLWMTATHVPLIVQASSGRVGWGAALWHSLPGFALFAWSTWLAVTAWRTEV